MHIPVLAGEALKQLNPKRGERFVDATVNGGGHARLILEKIGEEGKLLGIDWDRDLIKKLEEENKKLKVKNFITECDSYANLTHILAGHKFYPLAGILFDLGYSSYHIEASQRGFSFLRDEPLDMRYNPHDTTSTAAHIINTWSEKAITDLLWNYGEERYARRIARGIVHARKSRPINTTTALRTLIASIIPYRSKIDPATRTFQALRIAVNHELENVTQGLEAAIAALAPAGRIAVISFHSLEDRIVKNIFKQKKAEGMVKILTEKPLTASAQEIDSNPRARSAKLRAAQKI